MKGTIKSKRDVERLFREGRRSSSFMLTVLALPSPLEKGRCAFIAGKKLGSAPVRNRCKRVMRAAAQELHAPWNGFDVVFIAKRKVATADHVKLRLDIERQLANVGVVENGR